MLFVQTLQYFARAFCDEHLKGFLKVAAQNKSGSLSYMTWWPFRRSNFRQLSCGSQKPKYVHLQQIVDVTLACSDAVGLLDELLKGRAQQLYY